MRSIRKQLILSLLALPACFVFAAAAMGADEKDDILLPEPGPEPPPIVMQQLKLPEKYKDGSMRVEREVLRMSDDELINHGSYTEYYRNGNKFAQGRYNRGVHDGAWTFWHENGQLCKEIAFDNGVPNGSWDVFRADGTLLAKKSYKDGARVGAWAIYHDGGKQPKIEMSYRNGKLHGSRRTYYANGKVRQEIPFVDGRIHGNVVDWDQEGNKTAEREFVEGKVNGQQLTWGAAKAASEEEYRKGQVIDSTSK